MLTFHLCLKADLQTFRSYIVNLRSLRPEDINVKLWINEPISRQKERVSSMDIIAAKEECVNE